MNTVTKGRNGETLAASYLESIGYTIIERNYRVRMGEIDIIAVDGDTLVSVEVKSWRSFDGDNLRYSISAKKRASIVRVTRKFLYEHPEYRELHVRFDVLFLKLGEETVEHTKHAFTETTAIW